jgi:hypothetical protein
MLILLWFRHQDPPQSGEYYLLCFGVLFILVAGSVLWDRYYRRRWRNYRSRNWNRVDGRFAEGEVITMMTPRSTSIAGYLVRLGYGYESEGVRAGLYRLPYRSKDDAHAALTALAHQQIVVRVDPDKPDRSFVSDDDLAGLLPTPSPSK